MCVDVLKLSPILFNDTNVPPSSLPPWLWGGKCRQKLGTENFDPKLGRNWQNQLSLSHAGVDGITWLSCCDTQRPIMWYKLQFNPKFWHKLLLPPCVEPNQPYISINWNAAKDKKQLGTKFRETFYFFSRPVSVGVRAENTSLEVCFATLRGYKLWIYQNCDGKYLKRLTFVQRTFRLPCSSVNLLSGLDFML